MRINKFVALASSLSRRQADTAIAEGRVLVNGAVPGMGQAVSETDIVTLDGRRTTPAVKTTVLLNKPVGYVCSRNGQGSQTIYELLPPEYQHLNPVGRLDKNSSGLLLLTNDGDLANELTHPSRQKQKVYQVTLKTALEPLHRQMIQDHGIQLDDGVSKFELGRQHEGDDRDWQVTMHEGRNRQIRRTFQALGYEVLVLHRTQFGPYALDQLQPGKITE
ncbi:MAG: pseudouridine synthase, partial [Candidatus Saccharimonadales bacterium]